MEKSRDTKRLATSAFMESPVGSIQLFGDSLLSEFGGSIYPDKLGRIGNLPFHKKLEIIRHYYEVDPIASTVVNKIVDIGITGLYLDKGDCSDAEFEIYRAAIPVFLDYLKKAALEFLISGLVIPQAAWENKLPKDVGIKGTRRSVQLPTKIWILNPETIELKFENFTNDVYAYLKIPASLRAAIKEGGNKDFSKEEIESLRENFPALYKAALKGDLVLKLDDVRVIRRKPKTNDPYPTPYLLAAVEALEFKRNLRRMDYSIASRVVSAIQLIKLGNDEYPLLEDDEDQLEELKDRMLWRDKTNNVERIFQLFGNHTLDISWVYPDTAAMMDDKKYDAVNEDIFFALGFPRILVSGETQKSATSQAEFAMFSPAESIKRVREELLIWVSDLIKEMQENNRLKNRVVPHFLELRLYDISKLSSVAATLYDSGAISLTSLANSAGYNFRDEVYSKAEERKLMDKLGVPEIPAKPYSPTPGTPNQEGKDPEKKEVKNEKN